MLTTVGTAVGQLFGRRVSYASHASPSELTPMASSIQNIDRRRTANGAVRYFKSLRECAFCVYTSYIVIILITQLYIRLSFLRRDDPYCAVFATSFNNDDDDSVQLRL